MAKMKAGYLFEWAARRFADKIAVTYNNSNLTFTMVNERANRFCNGLISLGVRKGDRVAQLMTNCSEFLEVHFGCWKSGAVRVPLNARASEQEIEDQLNDSEANTIVITDNFTGMIGKVAGNCPALKNIICITHGRDISGQNIFNYGNFVSNSSPDEPCVEVDERDPVRMQYTSGTTGKLKAAVLSHDTEVYINELYLLNQQVNITENDVFLHVAPLSHASGLYSVRMYMKGVRQVILDKFDEKLFLETIQNEKVSLFMVVPTMIYMLLDYPEIKKYDLSSIRLIEYGASPMAAQRVMQALDVFGNVLSQWYGLSEGPGFVLRLSIADHKTDGPELVKRRMSAGKIDYGPEVKIVNEEGREVKPGEIGEIITRGRQVMLGYWRADHLTAGAIKDGWLHTGDMATVDEDGYVYIVDRKRDLIISGGFNIYPREVEEVLFRIPGVSEAAVIGVPDKKWGEAVKACIVKRAPEIMEEEIIAHCRQHLPAYKVPKSVDFIEEVPKNAYGKVLKKVLREKYWEGFERRVN